MKTIFLKLSFLSLTLLSFSSFAVDPIVIKDAPVVLEHRDGGYYYTPSSTGTTPTYYYVKSLEGKDRVCYLEKQTGFDTLDMVPITVTVGTTPTTWNCYEYNKEYFAVTP